MARYDEQWFQKKQGIAARFEPGIFAGNRVPDGAQAMLVANEKILPAGSVVEGEAILFRNREIEVPLVVEDLKDRDGVPGTLHATLVIEPPVTRTAMLLLRDAFLRDTDHLDGAQLAPYFAQRVRAGILRLLVERPWDGDEGFVPRLRKGEFLPALLREPLFDVGLSLIRVLHAEIDSEPLADRRARQQKLRQEAERVRERLEFLELWKREEMGQALARNEVQQLATHLEKEGMLRKLEEAKEIQEKRRAAEQEELRARGQLRRMLERERIAQQMEIDSERLEYEIEKTQKLKVALEEAGLLGAIDTVTEGDAKERLIQLLIEKDMTPEQISARVRQQEVGDLERRFEAFAEELRSELRGGRVPDWARSLPDLSRIWLAAGVALYRIEGDDAFAGGDPTPVLPPEDIGYIRSVRVSENGQVPTVLVGAQAGVAVYDPRGSHWNIHRYRPAPRGRGGANSVVLSGNRVIATHSEMGMHAWQRGSGDTSTALFAERIVPGVSTRGICLGPQGRAYFSHGASVYSVDPTNPGGGLESHGSLPESVTALAARGDRLVVGTRDGRLHAFVSGQRWEQLAFETPGPIFRIMSPGDGEDVGWIVGARECAVHVLDPDGRRIADYRSRYPIRWCAAGRQGVLGVDRFGQHLLLWSWTDARAPLRRIRVPDQIQYLAVERGPGCSA